MGGNRMLRLAATLDRNGQYDIADRLDRLAQRQMLLPLEMGSEKDYIEDVTPLLGDERPMWMDDEPTSLYHVTSDYPAVLQEGLMSREQLQSKDIYNQGLGGEITQGPYTIEDPATIATTYSYDRAESITGDLQQLALWLRGDIPTQEVLEPLFIAAENEFGDYEDLWSDFMDRVLNELEMYDIDVSDLREYQDDSLSLTAEDVGRRIDESDLDMEDKYDLRRNLESKFGEVFSEAYEFSDEAPPLPVSGFAAPYHAVRHLDPERIRMLELKVRNDAPSWHFPQEEQVNLYPWDLYLDTEDLFPHERSLIQRRMSPFERT